ncbi:DUF6443 domain-containing protein [Bacteroides sp. UBA939]|uniref:DUF6443 domain-containing protein n=1 Tax=Bacteroides sp. UBA939 TaxID=1946092 RepID=UPI0025C1C906|nr:DUF6443 domain-containing protein [Bacteroides sp. UBA939]
MKRNIYIIVLLTLVVQLLQAQPAVTDPLGVLPANEDYQTNRIRQVTGARNIAFSFELVSESEVTIKAEGNGTGFAVEIYHLRPGQLTFIHRPPFNTPNNILTIILQPGQYIANAMVSTDSFLAGILTSRPTGTSIVDDSMISNQENYILARTYTNDTGTKYLDNIQYFDGLGRPVQTVQRKITPTGKDLVTLQEYDAFGRASNTWLPGTSTGNGAYVSPETVKAAARTLNSDQNPYSRPVYEASPLNRVLEQYNPGAAWQNNSRRVKSSFSVNISGNDTLNCVLYKVSNTVSATDTLVTVTRQGYYPTGSLYVTRTADEDGNASFEFTDKLGQVLLTRQVVRSSSTKVLHDTYYIYDDYGNRTAVLPPLASDAMKGSTTASWTNANSVVLRNYAYLYIYDKRNRCRAKRLPGGDWTYYIYDKADRLIFSQDGEQRKKSPKEWTFSIPDVFGRVCVTGICSNTYNALATTSPLVNVVIKADRNNTTSAYKGYTILGLNLTTPTVLTVNYYDNYNFLGQNNIPPNTDEKVKYTSEDGYGTWYGTDYTTANRVKNKGLLTGTLTAQLTGGTVSTTNYLYTVMYYDVKGRLVQSKSNNHLTGGSEKEYFAYNFTGQATKRKHVHVAAGTTQTEIYTYAYDDAGRLTSVKHKLNTGDEVTLAANTYDELGRLATTQRNGNASLKSTYVYNVRSWMKSISSTLFTQTLYYNDAYGSNTPRYNGNISAMSWKLSNESKTRGYRFTYDNLSRLTAAGYLENGSVSSNFNTTYTYDKHGNMTGLTRRGNTGTSTYGIIDNLTMNYAGNQLMKVEDSGASVSLSASMDFKNGSNTAREYYYNRNGNLIKDLNKGISNISYNLLNLPCSLAISNSSGSATNTYVYAVDGRKLTATISGKKTDYAGNMIYENSTLKRILIEGGYIEIGSGSTTNDTYHFYLTDHLGNNRVVAKGSGTIVQTNHYYPYGMLFTEGTQTSSQPYKFGNKELDTQKGLNMYDFTARMQDPVVPGFIMPDPLAEKYYSISPYAYCMNNPMKFVDPSGKAVESIWDAISLGMGVKSLVDNIKAGNIGSAIVDGLGVVADAFAVAAPFVPGGVSAGIKALRAADDIVDVVSTGNKVDNAVDAGKAVDNVKDGLKIEIPAENKIDRNLLDPPSQSGNAPTFKKDGKPVEIHHEGQKPNGPFKEMHADDHRGKGNYKQNHPNAGKASQIDRREFDKAKKEYWKKEYEW